VGARGPGVSFIFMGVGVRGPDIGLGPPQPAPSKGTQAKKCWVGRVGNEGGSD